MDILTFIFGQSAAGTLSFSQPPGPHGLNLIIFIREIIVEMGLPYPLVVCECYGLDL
jgi:hypothetical protein